MSQIKLSQTASWNPALTNPYRTRWAEADGRYFKVSADSLRSYWTVEEVGADGVWITDGFLVVVGTLAQARTAIAEMLVS